MEPREMHVRKDGGKFVLEVLEGPAGAKRLMLVRAVRENDIPRLLDRYAKLYAVPPGGVFRHDKEEGDVVKE